MLGAMTALHDLTRRALDQAGVPHGATLVVAASGGLDSTVLLHLLGDLGHPLVVAHVDHGARGAQSDGDRDAVRVWAETRGFPFEVLTLDPEALKAGAQGFQGEARKSRMAWFDALCDTHSAFAFVTGHHADDQAETWMLHAMRSLDPLALAGMSLRDGRMIRPLLEATKAQLLALAQHHGWSWREDQSNDSSVYLRNRVRHEVLPLLDDLRPGTTRHLQELARRTSELHALMAPLIEDARREAEVQPGSWSTDVLDQRPLAREALQRMLKHAGWSHAATVEALSLLTSQVGSSVSFGSQTVVRERGHLRVLADETNASHRTCLQGPTFEGSESSAAGTVTWRPAGCPSSLQELSVDACWIPSEWLPVTLRCWEPGDRIQPLGMEGHSNVSDVLTQGKVPHATREAVLVLERDRDGRLLWVAGHKLSELARLDLAIFEHQPGLMLTHQPPTTHD